MKKFFILIFFLTHSFSSGAHMAHYNKFNKIEMEILRDGEVIGYNYYFFKKDGDKTTVTNQIKFAVKLSNVPFGRTEGVGCNWLNKFCADVTAPAIWDTFDNKPEKLAIN